MTLTSGEILIDRYRIEQPLGEGGFGRVYRAYDQHLKTVCAIKESLEVSPQAEEQFNQEARLLAQLHHPHLPRVYDFFSITGQGHYLVMEYIAGQDIDQLLEQRQAPFPEAQALTWIGQVLSAVNYLHTRTPPIIHRDIKPENIKITPDGQAMLVDFGIAKEKGTESTLTHGSPGTPGYAPQEQYVSGGVEPRSDLYAVGATMYRMLTNQKPVESIKRNLGAQLPTPHALNPSLHPATETAILRAMELLPTNRYPTAQQFLEQVNRCLAALQPAGGRPMPAPVPPKDEQRRNRFNAILSVGLVIAFLVFLYWLGTTGGKEQPASQPTVPPNQRVASSTQPISLQESTATRKSPYFFTPVQLPSPTFTLIPPTPTWPLDRTQALLQPLPTDSPTIRFDNINHLNIIRQWGGLGQAIQIEWTSDGKWLVADTSHGVEVIDAITLQVHHSFDISDFALSKDGRRIAGRTNKSLDWSTCQVWEIDSGNLALEWNPVEHITSLDFSPDGQYLAIGDRTGAIDLWELSGPNRVRQLTGHTAQINTLAFSPDGGRWLASGDEAGTIHINSMSDEPGSADFGHTAITHLAFSPDGMFYAYTTRSRMASLGLTPPGTDRLPLKEHDDWVMSVAFSPTEQILATGSNDGTLNLTSYYGNRDSFGVSFIRTFDAQAGKIWDIAFSPDGRWLAVASFDGAVQIWGIER